MPLSGRALYLGWSSLFGELFSGGVAGSPGELEAGDGLDSTMRSIAVSSSTGGRKGDPTITPMTV